MILRDNSLFMSGGGLARIEGGGGRGHKKPEGPE